jgi:hypothetical protein
MERSKAESNTFVGVQNFCPFLAAENARGGAKGVFNQALVYKRMRAKVIIYKTKAQGARKQAAVRRLFP